MKRKKKLLFCIVVILFIAIGTSMALTLNSIMKQSEENAFVIQRDHCFYVNAASSNTKYEVEYVFVSNHKDSIIFLDEGIVKSYLELDKEELHCNVNSAKEKEIFETTIDGEKYYVKSMILTISPNITPGSYKNCKLLIKYENGAYVRMDVGNISVERDENNNKNELETMLISSYGEEENDYDTFGVVWGFKAYEDIEILEISSQSTTYTPSLSDAIVLDEECNDYNLVDVIGKYSNAKIEKISNNKKTIKVSKDKEKIVILPLVSKRENILGYYSVTVKYRNANGTISEEVIDFTQTMNIVGITNDLMIEMKDRANGRTIINK